MIIIGSRAISKEILRQRLGRARGKPIQRFLRRKYEMETKIPFLEVSDAIVYSGAETLYWCMQCGLCTGTCPYRLVPGEASEQFNIRLVQRIGQLGLEGFESENCLFACTTCRACVDRCPRGVDIIGNVRGMRSMMAEVGTIPPSLKPLRAACTHRAIHGPGIGANVLNG